MSADAFARARRFSEPTPGVGPLGPGPRLGPGAPGARRGAVVATLTGLVASRGDAWHPPFEAGAKPRLARRAGGRPRRRDGVVSGDRALSDRRAQRGQPNPVHRAAAGLLAGLVGRLPTLRNNLGALMTLLLAILSTSSCSRSCCGSDGPPWPRRRQEVATTLRRQIHRQLYRLGESSLPSEGTGSVLTLFTREVNDIRAGLSAELTDGHRVPVLIVGLVLFALALSIPLTICPGRAGRADLDGLSPPQSLGRAGLGDRQPRVRAPALPAPGRFRPDPDRPGPRHGEHRQAAVRRPPRTASATPRAGGSSTSPGSARPPSS